MHPDLQFQPEVETRQPSLGSVSAPALLMILCMMAALPPAAYATAPEAPGLALAQRERPSDPTPEPQRRSAEDESQLRQISRALARGLDSLLAGGPAPTSIVIDADVILSIQTDRPVLFPHDRSWAPRRPVLERECDLPPPAATS